MNKNPGPIAQKNHYTEFQQNSPRLQNVIAKRRPGELIITSAYKLYHRNSSGVLHPTETSTEWNISISSCVLDRLTGDKIPQ
jgi:hypothetical protein